ncbi:radical SAM protein [Lagierella sp.]|uniref:radical SAM protein n=1 Tax=Lagierella sp. TaxID=2849657 RepID=UPI002630BB13|nr:radical SAM protein [Lagierella sp.]
MNKTKIEGIYYKIKDDKILIVDSLKGKWKIERINSKYDNAIDEILTNSFINSVGNIEKPSLNNFNLLIVDTTDLCNLRCKYCSMNATNTGRRLKENEFYIAFDEFLKLPNISEFLTIEFSGGEPLMNFKFIHNVVPIILSKAGKHNININFSIQTNGTLFNDNILDFIKKYNFSVGISIDGFKKWNNHRVFGNNVEAYDKIMNGINSLKNKSIPFSVLGVITNYEQYDSYLQFVYENDINYFRLNTLANIGRSENLNLSKNNIQKLYDKYAK